MLIVAGLCSCGGNINCSDEVIRLSFKGFDSITLSKVVLTKYEKGSEFTKIIDSVSSGSYSKSTVNDKGYILNNLTYAVINPLYDYTIYLAYTQKTFRIKGINFEQTQMKTSCKLCKNECYNNVTYYINDSLYSHKGEVNDPLYIQIYR